MPMNIARVELEREDRVISGRDAAEFRGVGLPVAADGVHVVGGRDRPEAGLLGELRDAARSSAPGTRRASP